MKSLPAHATTPSALRPAANGTPAAADRAPSLHVGAAPAATPIKTDPEQVSTLADVHAALDALNALEDSLTAELSMLTSVPLSTPAAFLADKSPEIAMLMGQSAQLLALASGSDSLTTTLGSQLKSLDLELRHLDKAIDRIHLLTDIKGCATNVQSAMSVADWETAAGYVERHLERITALSNAQPTDPTGVTSSSPRTAVRGPGTLPSTPRMSLAEFEDLPPSLQSLFPHHTSIEHDLRHAESILDATRADLKQALTAEFQRAGDPAHPDSPALLRCVSLFPRIGEHELGVSLFAAYLASMLADKCRAVAADAHQLGPAANVQLMTKVFENIALLVDQNAGMIEEKYGPGYALILLQELHAEASRQGLELVRGWMDKRRVDHMLGLAKQAVDLSARELDAALAEMVAVVQHADLFYRFLRHRARGEVASIRAAAARGDAGMQALAGKIDDQPKTLAPDTGLPLMGDLEGVAVKEMSNHYIALESAYFKSNVSRAMEIDMQSVGGEADASGGAGPLMSACVDDVFFLLKKCVFRALATRDLDVACTVLQEFESVVQGEFVGGLQGRLEALLEAFAGEPKAETRAGLMMQLNNLQQVVVYMPKFLDEVERSIQPLVRLLPATSSLPDVSQSSSSDTPDMDPKLAQLLAKRREKVAFSLGPYNRLAHSVAQVVHMHLEGMFETFLRSKVQALLKQHLYTNYTMDEDEYTQLAAANAYIGNNMRFVNAFSGFVANSKNELLPANLHVLLLVMVDFCIKFWESLIVTHRFSYFGALYLERDVRSFASYATSEASRTAADPSAAGVSAGGGASLSWAHSLREKLVGLHQVITLLTVSEPAEVLDYWGPRAVAPVEWKLKEKQVRQVLALRVEFAAEEVARLKL